jgi:hypothetical protein
MTVLLAGILTLLAAGVILWRCKPRDEKPVVRRAVAPYVAVGVAIGLLVGLGALFVGLGGLLANG